MIIGLDMGGTHVDAVLIHKDRIQKVTKKRIDQKNIFQSLWSTLEEILADTSPEHIRQINLSTTVSTNAIVRKDTPPVAMFIQSGPGLPKETFKTGEECIFLSGSIDHRGRITKRLNEEEVKEAIQKLQTKNIRAAGVVTKFSNRNPEHERKVFDLLKQHNFSPITMGHTLSGKLNFPRRIHTTYLNSAVYDTFNRFYENLQEALKEKGLDHIPIHMLKADGGTMRIQEAKRRPVETILSGPSASFMGLNAMIPTKEDALLLDIGGTTTDIFFLVDGVPVFEPLGIQIGPYKTLVRSIYSQSIGIGGDSFVRIIDDELVIGPERKGFPIAFGGKHPTPTDAMIVLGHLSIGDYRASESAIQKLADEWRITAEEMAEEILKLCAQTIDEKINELLNHLNSRPVFTIEEFLLNRRIEPKRLHIIGGPAKVLAPYLEQQFKLPCFYPENYEIANAIGAALAKVTTEITLEIDTVKNTLIVPELGVYEEITHDFSLKKAKEKAIEFLIKATEKKGASKESIEVEITEESQFNVVRGFFTSGKIYRVKAQVKPGTRLYLKGFDIYDATGKK